MCEEEMLDIYEHLFDYDDLKIAIVVAECLNEKEADYTYEDIADLVIKIRKSWENEQKSLSLTKEEIGYIQAYAWKYMNKYFKG